MKREISLAEYRAIDLGLFAVMLTISEVVIVSAATRWFPAQPFTVSVVPAVTAIVMMRWGPWAALHAVLGGLVFCAASRAAPGQYLIYMTGNLLGLGAALFLRLLGAQRVRDDSVLSLVFGFLVTALMLAGRALAAILTGTEPDRALGFITTDALSVLFTLVIVWISRRLDGVFENQKHYLLRIQKDREDGKGGF